MRRLALWIAALALAAPAQAPSAYAQRLDDHTILVPGFIAPDRQPDGNSVILETSAGLIVFDTGRHTAHSDAILAAAASRPIAIIVNSHWHLDHVSGNLRLRSLFPGVRVYASNAIDGALAGFLKTSAVAGRRALRSGKLSPGMAGDVRGDLATIAAGRGLRPDFVVTGTQALTLGGQTFTLFLSPHAATAGDVWLFDPKARRVIVGDLVTLPAPFLDTACPEGWDEALDVIDRVDFDTLVPGHGPVMTHVEFRNWKMGFENFIDCTGSERPMETCAGGWLASARRFLSEDEVAQFADMAFYYGEALRKGDFAKNCPA